MIRANRVSTGHSLCLSFAFLAVAGCATVETRTTLLCDENANRFKSSKEARAAGLHDAEYGATFCPEYKMHPSWDANKDGINDCVGEGSCGAHHDYMSVRRNL